MKVRRDDSGTSELLAGARTDLRGRSVILFDDEIWTGVTASQAARSLLDAGAARIDYVTVYDFTTSDIRKKMLEDVGVASFTTTNLALPAEETYGGRYQVLDAAGIIAERWPRIAGFR